MSPVLITKQIASSSHRDHIISHTTRGFLVPVVYGSAVSIFIFSCPALCLITSEWLWSFPLGSSPFSFFSLCDLIRRMIHTVSSLGFHRKRITWFDVPTALGRKRLNAGERFALFCARRYARYLPLILYVCIWT